MPGITLPLVLTAVLPVFLIPGTGARLRRTPHPDTGGRQFAAGQAGMPAAAFPMIIARRYGGDEATAMRVTVIITLVSLFTIPCAVKLCRRRRFFRFYFRSDHTE